MIAILLATIALLDEVEKPPPPPKPAVSGPAKDAMFAVAVESWVRATVKPWRYEQVLPAELADAVRGLACEHGACRTLWFDVVLRHRFAVRAAYYATVSKDKEVVRLGWKLFHRLMPCGHCKGIGMCPTRWGTDPGQRERDAWMCDDCRAGPFNEFVSLPPWADWGMAGMVPDWLRYRCLNCDGTGSLDFLLKE